MPKGPLNGPRPFAEYRIIVDPHELEIFLQKVGPLGGPRPFAKDNPPVSDVRVSECILSDAGNAFGAGVVSGGEVDRVTDLPPPLQKRALNMTEKWCRGILEATAMEDRTRRDVEATIEEVRSRLEDVDAATAAELSGTSEIEAGGNGAPSPEQNGGPQTL